MSLPGGGTVGTSDETSTGQAPRPGKAGRVLLFFLFFFGFVFVIPFVTVALVQAKYGLIDGPPSFPVDPFGETVKRVAFYGIFVWAGLQFFLFGRVASWAAQVPAVPGVEPATVETLMQRLLSSHRVMQPALVSACFPSTSRTFPIRSSAAAAPTNSSSTGAMPTPNGST